MSDEITASPITLHLNDNPEVVCTDFGPDLEDGETISAPVIVGIEPDNDGIVIASEAVNTSDFTAGGETVLANQGIKYAVTPAKVGTYRVFLRATSSVSPRKPAITQMITVGR